MRRLSGRRLRVALWLVAATGSLTAPAFWLLPATVPTAMPGGFTTDSQVQAPRVVPPDPAIAEEIALASIFRPDRTPPAQRYAPAGNDAGGAMQLESNASLAEEADSLENDDAVPRLLGTMIDSSGAKALLHLDEAVGPRLYVVGDSDGGFRIVSIAPRSATVAGPRGRVTLRLDPEENRP
jgi:hypothetical protein